MKTKLLSRRTERGHSLIEMAGVASILVLLTSILLPKVIGTLQDAKLTADTLSIQAMRDATETYFQQYGKLAGRNGTAITNWSYNAYEDWDEQVLVAGGYAETAMRSRLATNSYVRLVKVSNTSATANILTAVGQVGRLPSFNCNNGWYNMMMQYAQYQPPAPDGPAYASLPRFTGRRSNSPLHADVGSTPELPGLQKLFGVRHQPWSVTRGPLPGTRLINGLARMWQGVCRVFDSGPGPIRACYPVPPTWPEPPPGIGGGGGTDSPRHDDPGADSEIVAPDSTNPTIVAEIVLQGVSVQDAYRLSLAIDGRERSNWAFFDSLGRVKYDMYDSNGGTELGTVFIYLAHK